MQNTFVKGLITEANPLTFPENASLDEQNFVLNKDGSRQRRLGIDYEDNVAERQIRYGVGSNEAISTYLWLNAGNSGIDISVLQLGNYLYFFDNNATPLTGAILNNGYPLTVLRSDALKSGEPVLVSYASINGALVIVAGTKAITIISFDADTKTISRSFKNLAVRDSFGIYDTIDPNIHYYADPITSVLSEELGTTKVTGIQNPQGETAVRAYNLINQGWQDKAAMAVPYAELDDPKTIRNNRDTIFETWLSSLTLDGSTRRYRFPAYTDSLQDNLISGETSSSDLNDRYWPNLLQKRNFAIREIPRGSVILSDVFSRGLRRQGVLSSRSSASSSRSGFATDGINHIRNLRLNDTNLYEKTVGGIVHVTSYSGRIIYGIAETDVIGKDDNSPSLSKMIFFSQTVDGTDGIEKCYSELDPTSPDEFTVLDTDGGFFNIKALGTLTGFASIGNSLFIFADNGIWQVNGGEKMFSASNINITRISNIGALNQKSIVVANNAIYMLVDAGLYQLVLSDVDPSLPATLTKLSQTTIQTRLDSYSTQAKSRSTGVYDEFNNTIRWLIATDGLSDGSFYDTELVLDLTLGSFYFNKIYSVAPATGTSPYIIAFNKLQRPAYVLQDEDVTVAGTTVTANTIDVTVENKAYSSFKTSSVKYWALRDSSVAGNSWLTACEYSDTKFRDWASIANNSGESGDAAYGADAYGFLLTGYLTGGDYTVEKRTPHIHSFFRRTEQVLSSSGDGFVSDDPSGCLLTGQWAWTSSANTGRWTNPQQAYRLPRVYISESGEFDYGFEVVDTKLSIRGKGEALSLLYQTEPLKNCHLYGWAYEISAENTP